MRIFRALSLLSLSITLISCSTTRGPTPTMEVDGPFRTGTGLTGLPGLFVTSELTSRTDSNNSQAAQQMLHDGFSLIYSNCNEFFYSAGKTQQWVIVSRDTVGAVGTLATSVLALHDASSNAVANLALATGLAFTGLDIYTKNFLFAAENIDSVRTLVTNALAVHHGAALNLAPFTYQSATLHLLDNQNICTPAAITTLVRQAIKKGDVQPNIETTTSQQLRSLGDQAVLRDIGAILNPPGAITPDQAGALWWLFEEFSTAEQKKIIADKLSDLPDAANPFDKKGQYKSGWPDEDKVKQALQKFSPETRQAFKDTIAKTVVAPAAAAAGQAAALQPPGDPFQIPRPPASTQSGRVTIDIR